MRIGIDLGGTKIEGVVLDPADNGRIITRKRIPTEADRGYRHIVERVVRFVRELASPYEETIPVGIGMPGSLTREGRVKNANTVCLNGQFFRQEVTEELARPVRFDNDANCFALAEAILGAGRGHDVVFGVIMGTGVGGGLVLNGIVRDGPQSVCGEWGHTILWPDDPRDCYCGKRGCVEQFLSGPSLEYRWHKTGLPPLGLPAILDRYQAGEEDAVRFVDEWMDFFARAISNVINILDPDAIVLGGGVSNSPGLYDDGTKKIEKYIFSDSCTTPILKNELGDSAGVIGAALLS